MFDKEYSFKGTHAEKVIKLTEAFDNNSIKIFARNIDVYIIAPIIGFVYRRKATVNKSKQLETKIFAETLINEQTTLKYNYQLIMLLDKQYESDFGNRLNKAFRYYGSGTEKSISDEELYNQYILGGVEVLYEKIIESANTKEDYVENVYKLIEEFNDRYYNDKIYSQNIYDLCRLASDF